MKTLAGLFGTMALMFALSASNAQTNSTAPTAHAATLTDSNSVAAVSSASTNAMAETEIFSDHFDLDSRTRIAVYTGNVRVIDPRMRLTCDTLTGQMGESTNRFRHVVAEGNVVIDAVDNDGKPVQATSGRADYDYHVQDSVTNEVVELTLNPHVKRGTDSITGKVIDWDRQRDTIHVEESAQHFTGSPDFFGGGTNKPVSPPRLIRTNK